MSPPHPPSCHAPSRRRKPLDHPRQLGPCKFASAPSASSARIMFYSTTPARREGSPRDPLLRPAPTMLTVLTVSSALVLTLIIRVPLRPSRENVISIPIVRRNVCARRRRPESALGFFAHAPPVEISLRALSAHKLRRSDALPVHMVRLAIIVRTQVAMGSASMMLSIPALRLAA
jgi:hypothetical protein